MLPKQTEMYNNLFLINQSCYLYKSLQMTVFLLYILY